MNEPIETQLAAIVDAVVRPLWAMPKRKSRIREELLAHVTAVFEEEFAHLSDDRAALDATRRRFGVAVDLERQLQASVPLWGDLLYLFQKEHPMSRWLWFMAAAAVAFGMAILLPALAKIRHEQIYLLFPLALGGAITLAGLCVAGYGIVRGFTRAA